MNKNQNKVCQTCNFQNKYVSLYCAKCGEICIVKRILYIKVLGYLIFFLSMVLFVNSFKLDKTKNIIPRHSINTSQVKKTIDDIKLSWKDALNHCTHYSYNGIDAWRLPTREELLELYKLDKTNFFSVYYWSSSIPKGNKEYANVIHFKYGLLDAFHKNHRFYVRCIKQIE